MISKINRFAFVFLVVALALYVVILNTAQLTVHLTPGTTVTGSSGVILIATLFVGILVAGVVGLFFGVKGYLRERRLQSQAAQAQAFYTGMLQARASAVCGEWNKARSQWETLIKKDPTNVIARIELSRCLQATDECVEALRILDAARATDPRNEEVLFRAAELNIALGNKTAAIDNLALILHNHPSKKAASVARDLSEELGRLEDALEYHSQILAMGGPDSELNSIGDRLEFKRLVKSHEGASDALRAELRTFVRKHPEFVPALRRLALLEAEAGNTEDAAQYYIKAAKASRSSAYWNEVAKLWVSKGMPERALAAARTAAKETSGEARLIAELELIRIQLSLNQTEDARRSLDAFEQNARALGKAAVGDIILQYFILRGAYYSMTGAHSQAAEVWKRLSRNDLDLQSFSYISAGVSPNEAPAARLSTP